MAKSIELETKDFFFLQEELVTFLAKGEATNPVFIIIKFIYHKVHLLLYYNLVSFKEFAKWKRLYGFIYCQISTVI